MGTQDWQKVYINRVLDYHNKKNGTNIFIRGSYSCIHPASQSGPKWDWVCYDKDSGCEVAVEVKQLTSPVLEEKISIVDQIRRELSNELYGIIKGTFILTFQVSEEYRFSFSGREKQVLSKKLTELIFEHEKSLKIGESHNLIPDFIQRLPDIRLEGCHIELSKQDDEGSHLSPNPVSVYWGPYGELQGADYEEFKKVIHKADKQLAEAMNRGILSTFLIVLDSSMGVEPEVLRNTLRRFSSSDYRHIKYIYYGEH